jgi:hypothetical protein
VIKDPVRPGQFEASRILTIQDRKTFAAKGHEVQHSPGLEEADRA